MKTNAKKIDTKKLVVRIMAILLAALMVLGGVYYTVLMIRTEIQQKRLQEEILDQINGNDADGHEGHEH